MKRFSIKFLDVPNERKLEIKDFAIQMEKMVKSYFYDRDGFMPTASVKIDKAYSFYKREYGDNLNEEEKTIFFLYVLFPDDEYFDSLIMRYDKDFQKISTLYAINQLVIKFRYLLEENINIEKENQSDDVTYKKTIN